VEVQDILDFYNSNIKVIDTLVDLSRYYKSQISILEQRITTMEIDLSDGTLALDSLKRSLSLLDSTLSDTTHKLDSLTNALTDSGHSIVHVGSGIDLACSSSITVSRIDAIIKDYYQGVTNSEGILTGSSETVGIIESVIREHSY